MIRILRHSLILLTGAMLSWSLISTPWLMLPILSGILTLLWLFAGMRFSIISTLSLPLYTAAILTGFLFSGTILIQGLLFILLLTCWETDMLYRDSWGLIKKRDELRLLLPLLLRGLLSLILMILVYYTAKKTGLRIGFWPLVGIVLLLIVTLRKYFRIT